ncbi:MAG TPA: IclR family transcriptional regulator [Deinococcales bacterium]|nr:IclR family transcriptional regulator [Deinococcales bacterium]
MLLASAVQSQYVISSAYRTLQVLLAFGAPPHRFTLAEVTARLGLEKNQVFRSLKTLEEAGFVRVESDGRYALTAIVGVLAGAAAGSPQASLVEVAAPQLDRVVAATRESVNLFVLAGETAVCVDRRDSPQVVRVESVLGRSVTLHAGAAPKAILAFMPPAEREAVLAQLGQYQRYTDRTILDPDVLREDLAAIRERGYAISDEDVDSSARGVGAPILGRDGFPVGAVSVGGPSFRVTREKLCSFGELISQVGRAVSRQLGFPG